MVTVKWRQDFQQIKIKYGQTVKNAFNYTDLFTLFINVYTHWMSNPEKYI